MDNMEFSLMLKARILKQYTIINEKYEASLKNPYGQGGDSYYKGCRDAYDNVLWLIDLYEKDNKPTK